MEPLYISTSFGRLAYATYGERSAPNKILYLHGFPGSRLEASFASSAANELGISLIALDRPGYGASDYCPKLTLENWPELLNEALNCLGIPSCSLVAVSGAGPYALSALSGQSHLISSAAIISGLGPLFNGTGEPLPKITVGMILGNRALLYLGMKAPTLAQRAVRLLGGWWAKHPDKILAWFKLTLCKQDVELLEQPNFSELFIRNIKEGLRSGTAAAERDITFYAKPWGFNVERIRSPITFWHGTADRYVPVGFACYLHSVIASSKLNLIPSAGHLLMLSHLRQILEQASHTMSRCSR